MLLGLAWASTALGIYAASQEAPIYIQDDSLNGPTSKTQSISANTARLLLAQRLGLSQYHDLGDADEVTLDVLNTYGGQQQSIFGEREESRQQSTDKLLFIIEGVEYPEGGSEYARELISMLMNYFRCDRIQRKTKHHDCQPTQQRTECKTRPRFAQAIAPRRFRQDYEPHQTQSVSESMRSTSPISHP